MRKDSRRSCIPTHCEPGRTFERFFKVVGRAFSRANYDERTLTPLSELAPLIRQSRVEDRQSVTRIYGDPDDERERAGRYRQDQNRAEVVFVRRRRLGLFIGTARAISDSYTDDTVSRGRYPVAQILLI